MSVQEIPWLLVAFVVGAVLAVIRFTGLWLTVKRLPRARHPAAFTLSSHFVRLLVTLGGFVVVAWGGHWPRLIAGLIGFIVGRMVLTRILGPRTS